MLRCMCKAKTVHAPVSYPYDAHVCGEKPSK